MQEIRGKAAMYENLSGLADDDYFRAPLTTAGTVRARLVADDFLGVVLDGPHVIDSAAHSQLPLLAYRRATLEEEGRVPYDKHAVLIGVDLERNHVYAGPAQKANENEIVEEITRPAVKGTSFEYRLGDARELLNLPWRTGKYLFTVVIRDTPSNRVEVELKPSPNAYQDEEVIKFLAAQKALPSLKPVFPPEGVPFPSYSQNADSPQPPDRLGITIKMPRVSRITEDLALPIYGSYLLPVLPHEIVPEEFASKGQSGTGGIVDQEIRRPTAIVPIALVVVGSEAGFVTKVTLRVPSYDKFDRGEPSPVVRGYFSIDLLRFPGMTRTPQTYFIYPISGRVMEKSVPSALVRID
jgi:hypothetical protein